MSQKKLETALQVYVNAEFGKIRAVLIDGKPYFVGKDVAQALGYQKPQNAVAVHVDEEDKTTALIQGTGSNYKSNAVLINESGLYSLILSSKLEGAKAFKHWVTSEVLPSIRRTGGYNVQAPAHDTVLDKTLELARLCSTDPELLKLLQSVTKQPDVVEQPAAEKEYTDTTDPAALNVMNTFVSIPRNSEQPKKLPQANTITVGDLFNQYVAPQGLGIPGSYGNKLRHSVTALYEHIDRNFHSALILQSNGKNGVHRKESLVRRDHIDDILESLVYPSDTNARL